MTFKRLAMATALGASMFSGVAAAELSGNVNVTSEYFFRGISQGFGAAVNGGLDYEAASGFYTGIWASTLAGGEPDTDFGTHEVDLYAGFAGEAGSVGYDVGLIYYWYPTSKTVELDKSANTIELYGSLSFGALTVGAYYAPSSYFGVDESAYGLNLGFSAPVSDKLSFDAFIGYNAGKGNEDIREEGAKNYIDYSIGLSTELENGFSASFGFVGANVKDQDPTFVVSGGYSFGL